MAGRNPYTYTPSYNNTKKPRQESRARQVSPGRSAARRPAPRPASASRTAQSARSASRPAAKPVSSKGLETILLTVLFLVVPICGIIGVFVHAFLWIFIALAALCVLAMWGGQIFAFRGRIIVSVVLILLCAIAGLSQVQFSSGGSDYPGYGEGDPISSQQSTQRIITSMASSNPAFVGVGTAAATAPLSIPEVPTTAPTVFTGTTVTDTGGATLSAAQQVLESYLRQWSMQQWQDMVQYTTPSWRSALETPYLQLFWNHGGWLLNSWKISTDDSYSSSSDSATFTVIADITRSDSARTPAPQQYNAIVLNVDGAWYVDPDSMRNGVAITATATPDPALANAQLSSDPTPIPEPTTNPTLKLYYNTKGGSFYHLVQKCESINSKYYDSMAAFLYSELGDSPYNKLKPCSSCNAPSPAQ